MAGLFAGAVAAGFCQFDARRVELIVVLAFRDAKALHTDQVKKAVLNQA